MKSLFLTCLLGLGLLLPSTNANASHLKTIDTRIEGWTLDIQSDDYSGEIKEVQIYDAESGKYVGGDVVGGLSCTFDLSDLGTGNFVVYIITTETVLAKEISIQE